MACSRALSSQIKYKKGHDERKAKYTSLAEPPEMEQAKKNFTIRSNVSTQANTNQTKGLCIWPHKSNLLFLSRLQGCTVCR